MWRKILALNRLQWRYLFASWLILPVIDLGLRLLGYKRMRSLLNRWAKSAVRSHENTEIVAGQVARVVSVAARWTLWPTSCLRQAILLWWFLARRNIAVEVRIGVSGDLAEHFSAHAWVEQNGRVLLGGEHARERYAVLL